MQTAELDQPRRSLHTANPGASALEFLPLGHRVDGDDDAARPLPSPYWARLKDARNHGKGHVVVERMAQINVW